MLDVIDHVIYHVLGCCTDALIIVDNHSRDGLIERATLVNIGSFGNCCMLGQSLDA